MSVTTKSIEDLKKQYQKEFKPSEYSKLGKEIAVEYPDLRKFRCSAIQEMLKESGLSGRLLEVSTGPTIQLAALASSMFSEIVLSEFVDSCREVLTKWVESAPDALDWNSELRSVAEAEGFSDIDAGVQKIAQRTRKAVKKILPCDVTASTVLPPSEKEKPFDCIISSLTLEAAALDYDSYVKYLENVSKLLRPGGGFLLKGVTECTSYEFGESTFPVLSLTLPQILEAVRRCGFSTIHVKAYKRPESMTNENFKQSFISFHVKE